MNKSGPMLQQEQNQSEIEGLNLQFNTQSGVGPKQTNQSDMYVDEGIQFVSGDQDAAKRLRFGEEVQRSGEFKNNGKTTFWAQQEEPVSGRSTLNNRYLQRALAPGKGGNPQRGDI